MGRQRLGAVRALARCSRSTPMARVLRPCIVSQQSSLILIQTAPIAMEPIRSGDWFYRATACMGRQSLAAVRAMAQFLDLARMARVLRSCIVSAGHLRSLLVLLLLTAMGVFRLAG